MVRGVEIVEEEVEEKEEKRKNLKFLPYLNGFSRYIFSKSIKQRHLNSWSIQTSIDGHYKDASSGSLVILLLKTEERITFFIF